MPDFNLRKAVHRVCAWLALGLPLVSMAQMPPLDSLVGADEAAVLAALPQAQHLNKPRLGPRGLRGQWTLPGTQLAMLPFETVLFFRNKQLQRIEQTWGAPGGACSEQTTFAPVSQSLQARYGDNPVLASSGDAGEQQLSAAWARAELEVVAHFTKTAARCSLRVVYQAREAKDASEL